MGGTMANDKIPMTNERPPAFSIGIWSFVIPEGAAGAFA
jgi:hypothetical protein